MPYYVLTDRPTTENVRFSNLSNYIIGKCKVMQIYIMLDGKASLPILEFIMIQLIGQFELYSSIPEWVALILVKSAGAPSGAK